MTDPHQSTTANSAQGDKPRRHFLVEAGSVIVGGVVGLFGLASGLVVFFDPLLRRHKVPELYQQEEGAAEGFIHVATLDAVPDDGVPRRFPVIADLIDAWNFTPQQPVGAVYLLREKGEQNVTVFHATCPHAGCSVSYAADAHAFQCPCHNSAFDLHGEKVNRPGKENPSPRPLDKLEVDDQRLAAKGEVWVKFVNYYTGIHEQKQKI